ncbi:hypothetical protein LPUS_05258 [Lasallia pustulata]|uniref:DUF7514 domain-containing protein n=1 Tax=Lasallia pustulata TaxID=136370 RepID=A0A1W5CYB4_9LECA|nr:hypothetical protein LPUS_05258 [Lasallia pustulata]
MAFPPPSEDPPFFEYSDPRMHYPSGYTPAEAQTSRPPASSSTPTHTNNMQEPSRYRQSQQPIREAVSSAAHHADDPNQISPEVISRITESVLKQLKTSGLDAGTPAPPSQQQYPPPPLQPAPQPLQPAPQPLQPAPQPLQPAPQPLQPAPQSPSAHSGYSPNMTNRVYTPPSPNKHSEFSHYDSELSQSAVPHSPPYNARRPGSPTSVESGPNGTRPRGPERLSTGKEETTLEKVWGQLFDEGGNPTVRLGQLLRGLAIHIIEDYEPCHSIVITPAKMLKYYEDVKLPNEIYPWHVVFDDERSSISRMYRDLACQHHLVQERYNERPDIASLTPVGFERWVTILLQAHPDLEYERLQKAVLDMPISNPDDKKERFPKEISRRLFPISVDRKARERFEKAVADHAKVEIPRQTNRAYTPPRTNLEPSPIHPPYTGAESTYVPPSLERERKPYATIPTESAIDDTVPLPALPQQKPLERERQPYTAQPGGGKTYEDDLRARGESLRPVRSNSSSSNARPIATTLSQRAQGIPPQDPSHRQQRSMNNAAPSRRYRSPSISTDFRHSDGNLPYQPPYLSPEQSFEDRTADDLGLGRTKSARQGPDPDAGRNYVESPRAGGEAPHADER